MKFVIIVLAMCVVLSVDANEQGSFAAERLVLTELLDENRITQLDYNNKVARLDYLQKQSLSLAENQMPQLQGGGTASISGTVQVSSIDAENVTVTLMNADGYFFVDSVLTDQFGTYNFSALAAGNYYVVANDSIDDYIDVMWSTGNVMVQCQYCQPDAGSTIVLGDGVSTTGIDFDLEVGAVISGHVSDGGDVVGIWVQLQGVSPSNFSLGANTDVSGAFTFRGLPAGDYYSIIQNGADVYIDAMWSSTGTVQCGSCSPDVDSTISLTAAEVRNGIDYLLTIGAVVTGQVIDEVSLAGVETLSVNLFNAADLDDYWYLPAVFDGSGNYTISGIPAGDYRAYLDPKIDLNNVHIPEIYNNIQCNACTTLLYDGAGDSLLLVNGATTANIDFSLEVGASISGIILNNDYPTETVQQLGLVYFFNDSNRVLATQLLYGTDFEPMADGQYKVGGLLPGMYFVQGGDLGREFFQRELFENIHCPWSGCDRGAGGDPVVLGVAEQRLGVNFLLNYGGKISGTVTDLATGMPIVSAETQYVQFYDSTGAVAGGADIGPDGSYISRRALPPGTYSVRTGTMFNAVFNSPYVMQKYAPGGNIDCPGVTCDLTDGNVTVSAYVRQDPRDPVAEAAAATVTGIDFALSPGFSFSGTITELGSSTPIPEVHVLVYDAAGNFANWATTNELGDFTVHGLPAGTYYAITNNGSNLPFMGLNQTEAGGWIDILFDGTPCPGSACDVTTGDPIVLGGPGIESANGLDGVGGTVYDFGLNPGGTITGQVRNKFNQVPASGIDVNVYDSSGEFFGSYQTDNDGNYMTVGFPAGTYYLTTSNNGALLDVMYGGAYCIDGNCNPLDASPLVISGSETLVDRDMELNPDYIFRNGME
ncbi:MAG: MSCRAMM family protein [Marinicella sp.]